MKDFPVISIETLKDQSCALIDGTSVLNLFQGFGDLSVRLDSPGHPLYRELRRRARSERPLYHALAVVERMVAYDFLVADRKALDSINITKSPVGDLVQVTDVPENFYNSAYHSLSWLRSRLVRKRNRDGVQFKFFEKALADNAWDGSYLEYHQRIVPAFQSTDPTGGEDVLRFLYYQELASFSSTPVFLSPSKDELYQVIHENVLPEAFRLIETTVDRSVASRLHKMFTEAYRIDFGFDFPPIAALIFRFAEKEGTSLWDAALHIRSLQAARDFRRWVREIQCDFLRGQAGTLDAYKNLKKFDENLRFWLETQDPNAGLKFRPRKAKLKALPWSIGKIFESAGIEEVNYRDPILGTASGYQTFVASWYKEDVDIF